ncbi:hypothetical protein SAMN04489859_102055 [Paracoccus alcaliphilus]|uniref:Uncharacterized protein n=1 Tax=Paracoccus alcaliphilus TaxID=34002 RepID=A0A1H8K601_9RHOB|nr:hypothetical protein [Paracoccus alcaliphilus]WCR17550.1 hypothetical protein JHW40_14615 [Paracoccus alcaliphilus]SEN87886.1 hypothetical protein SAMN04489859_102055 [Paracoccus alcaliphilus]
MNKPMPSTVSAAIAAEGPLRSLLKAIQRDDATCNGVQAEWTRQLLGWVIDAIEGAEPACGWPNPAPVQKGDGP